MACTRPISLRLPIHHRQQDHGEALLHLRVLEKLIQHDLRLGPAFQLDHNPHAVAIRFVAHVRNVFNRLSLTSAAMRLISPALFT